MKSTWLWKGSITLKIKVIIAPCDEGLPEEECVIAPSFLPSSGSDHLPLSSETMTRVLCESSQLWALHRGDPPTHLRPTPDASIAVLQVWQLSPGLQCGFLA